MENSSVKSGNEIIAEFMGVEFKKGHTQNKYWHYDQLQLTSSTLIFDTSWDWLMPVVEKIRDLNCIVVIRFNRQLNTTTTTIHKFLRSDGYDIKTDGVGIESTYKAVLEFITWYQNNKQPKQ